MDGRKLLGLAFMGLAAFALAPKETAFVIQAAARNLQKDPPPNSSNNREPIYEPIVIATQSEAKGKQSHPVGFIRSTGRSIVSLSKQFWKWIY